MMAFQDTLTVPPQDMPGALQDVRERQIPGGKVTFEFAPAGWTGKGGKRRTTDWRAYYFEPDGDGKRERMTSVTTLLDSILPKGGLPRWAEARGIEGAIEAIRAGIIPIKIWPAGLGGAGAVELDPEAAANAVDLVRANRLGADRARDDAATRGLNIHDLLQQFMETGTMPDPAAHPVEHQGYVRALVDFLEAEDLEPVAVEELVCDPDAGYAGRYDLCAKTRDGRVGLFDAKTSEKLAIWPAAHLQTELYRRAMLACGDGEMDFTRIVVFGPDGIWRQMPAVADRFVVDKALDYAAALRPVASACERANRAELKAREVVA